MKKSILNVTLLTITAFLAGCMAKNQGAATSDSTGTVSGTATTSGPPSADRGKYLVTAIGCNDCHTPWTMGPNGQPGPDMTKMLSGHPAGMKLMPTPLPQPWVWAGDMTMTAFQGPWGVSYSANLTPDSVTGIGAWSQDVFVNAIRSGKHMGKGRPILPPMPWNWIKELNDNDLASIFMYLRTIPAISNQVPDPVPPQTGMMGGPGAPPMPGQPGMPPGAPPAPPPHHHK